jgi:6-phosphogluconolactonase
MATVKTFVDGTALTEAAAQHVLALAEASIADKGRFSVALSGGSTPRSLYARLAQDDRASQVDWSCVHVFWGDERAVPPDHEDSNYRMAREALLNHVPLPPENVHRISGELAPAAAAAEYEGMLRTYFAGLLKEGKTLAARFDLVLLGMGDDGHTASLFPGAAAIRESRHWVASYHVAQLDAWRITLTPIAINAAAQATFLVSGANKAERLQQVLYGPYQPDVLPAQIVRPEKGRLLWLIDEAAAGRL